MSFFSPYHLDVLTEIFNVGVGRSANALSEMFGESVHISVPSVKFLSVYDALKALKTESEDLYGIQQTFRGGLSGNAILMVPIEHGKSIVKTLSQSDNEVGHLDELGKDVLTELGNIVLNACLSALSDMLQQKIDVGSISIVSGKVAEIIGMKIQNRIVMILEVKFTLNLSNIDGHMVFVLDTTSTDDLKEVVSDFLDNL